MRKEFEMSSTAIAGMTPQDHRGASSNLDRYVASAAKADIPGVRATVLPLSFGLDQPQHLPWRIIRHAVGSAQIIDATGATRITECAMPVASFIVTCVNANDKLVAECCRQAEALMDLHALVVKEQPSKERDARLDAVTRGMFGEGGV